MSEPLLGAHMSIAGGVFNAFLHGQAVGCNTIQGAGKDIERGGEKIQDKAKNVQQNM